MSGWSKLFHFFLCFCLGCLVAGLFSACQPQSNSASDKPCHWVEHAAGKTCVPNRIERLVTLDEVSFENAIALGLTPIGTTKTINPSLQNRLDNVVEIGLPGEPNLEKVLALKPDLILGLDYQQNSYHQASQIAPTVLIKLEHSGQWAEAFQAYGQALNQTEIGEQVMTDYQQRLQDFQQRFETKSTLNKTLPFRVSVVRIYPDVINLYFRDSFPGTILHAAKLDRPAAQDFSASQAQQRYQNPIQASISLENIEQTDGDILFILTAENTAEANQSAKKNWEKLKTEPLWQQMKAVQNDQVYFVPSYWIGSGPIAANAVIDDLFQYLLKDPQALSSG
jgi:iron complex transport system substrate-binding protein